MDIISDNWLSELEMDDEEYNIFHQYQINNTCLDDFIIQDINPAPPIAENLMIYQSVSADSHSGETCNTSFETRPAKQPETSSWNSCSSSSQILSFASGCKFDAGIEQETGTESKKGENKKCLPKSGQQGTKRARETTASNIKSPSHAQDHIMAERRRREKLSQRFIALSAIVPGLKKMDKATVLGDAIKYLKQLQERVNLLEEQTKKRTIESVVFVNRSHINAGSKSDHEDNTSSSDENTDVLINESLPEIEARVFEKNVLIRIHCENSKGVIGKVLSEIEKHHLCVQNSSAMPFGNHALDITVLAQMETEYCMTVKDLVKNIRSSFLKFMS